MNEPDPTRDPIQQLDHDVRGMRQEFEALGRMLVTDTATHKRQITRQRWHNRALYLAVATLFLLTFCQHARSWRRYMGYANGTECCQGACHIYAKIEDRIGCCASVCPQFVDECIDKCVITPEVKRADVFVALSNAGRILRGGTDGTDADTRDRMDKFINVMARNPDRQYRLTAQRIKQEIGV